MQLTSRLFAVNLLCLSLLAGSAAAATPIYGKLIRGTLIRMTDGDTITIMPEGAPVDSKGLTVRMVSMDTAELHLPAPKGQGTQGYWGEQGLIALQSMLNPGDVVEIDALGLDSHNRTLGVVYKNRRDINLEMVKSGWAALYEICDEVSCLMESQYRTACRKAMKEGRGLFNPANPVPELPFLFRARVQGRKLEKFVGNYRTKKYVSPERYAEVPLCERIFFMQESDAQREGFKKVPFGYNPNR